MASNEKSTSCHFFLISIVLVIFLAFPGQDSYAKERLLYAVSVPTDRGSRITNIFGLDIETGNSELLFETEKAAIEFLPEDPDYFQSRGITRNNRLISNGASWDAQSKSNYHEGIFELSLDGSNKYRKITDVLGDGSVTIMFVNDQATKVGYINHLKGKELIFIHDAATGKLLAQIDLSKKLKACCIASIGWLSDDKQIAITFDTPAIDEPVDPSFEKTFVKAPVTYFYNISTDELTKFPLKLLIKNKSEKVPYYLGQLQGGEFVFYGLTGSARIHPLIYFIDPRTKAVRIAEFDKIDYAATIVRKPNISPSGKLIAFMEKERALGKSYTNLWIASTDGHGEPKKVLTILTRPLPHGLVKYPWLIGWVDQ